MEETDAGPGGVGAEPACSGGGGRWLRVRGSGHRASCHKRESLLLSAPVWRSGLRRLCMLVAQSCLTLCNPTDCSPPGFSAMEFSRQEYWSGLPFPSPEDLPDLGTEPWSPALQADSLLFELQGNQRACGRGESTSVGPGGATGRDVCPPNIPTHSQTPWPTPHPGLEPWFPVSGGSSWRGWE